jgi:hypothetical protein
MDQNGEQRSGPSGCLILLGIFAVVATIGMWETKPMVAAVITIAAILWLVAWLWPKKCEVCGVQVLRASNVTTLDGKKLRVCARCRWQMEREGKRKGESDRGEG